MLTKGFLAFGNLLKNTTKEHPNGIQEVSGSIPLISTKKPSISFEIDGFSILFSLFCTGRFRLGQQMDNRPSQFLLFLLREGILYQILILHQSKNAE